MARHISLGATALLSLSLGLCLIGCKLSVTRPDQDNFVLNTNKVPVEHFLEALSTRLSGEWEASDYAPPDADASKMYTVEGDGVTVVLSPMPHGRCNSNAPHHLTYDPAYRVDFVYKTSAAEKREVAKRKLFQAASAVGEHLVRFEECPD